MNSELVRGFADALSVAPRTYSLSHGDANFVVFCFAKPVRGCTGATLLDYGFCTGMLADLVRDGLATARLESKRMGKRKIAVARVRITDAGQMALEGAAKSE